MKMLQEARKKAGLTLKELGLRVNLAESTMSQYENGKRNIDNSTLVELSKILNVSTDYLLGSDKEDEYSIIFRNSLVEELAALFPADDEGIDNYYELEELANSKHPLSLAEACNAADKLGSTVGSLLQEDCSVSSDPISILDRKLLSLFDSLNTEDREKIMEYAMLIAGQEKYKKKPTYQQTMSKKNDKPDIEAAKRILEKMDRKEGLAARIVAKGGNSTFPTTVYPTPEDIEKVKSILAIDTSDNKE